MKVSQIVRLALFASLPVFASCSSDPATPAVGGTGGTSGGGGSGGGATEQGVTLAVNATGGIDMDATLGIQGAWYAYGDMVDCAAAGHDPATCSMITMPAGPTYAFSGVTGNKLCTTGTAAKVLNGTSGAADYTSMFGTGIGLDLNNAGGANGKMPYNATGKVTGISFDIDMVPLGGLRVELPTPATTQGAAYWGGKANNTSPVKAGHNSFKWADVTGPMYLATPPAFDPTMILSVQFHIPTNTSAAIPFSYCVSNLKLLTN